ncbi:YolD-like family protein [Alkalihalobacillus sp. MEB130]|uniref:YolD-like family protein n=1 Tax=Alkalihalobacillus sp. MEB130 TaxID=2976704 RepID=UPI0028DFA13A|nr:YolD-like family protein [Alkalihalobacillus sp. MEB130]MDT8861617.1 YolD-like family protein [Alkalihalobacillus sp. MEB130]
MNEQPLQRANVLWESSRMFLPEHKEALMQQKQQKRKVAKPELDEQELEEIGTVVLDSLKHELAVQITYWEDGQFHELIGTIDRIDWHSKKVKVRAQSDHYIAIEYLKSVDRL